MDKKLYEIIEYLLKRQQILTELLIHIGSRTDMLDNFICEKFKELDNLYHTDTKAPEVK